MKIEIPQAQMAATRAAAVSIDEVHFVGDVTAAKLTVSNARVKLMPAAPRAEGVVIELKLSASLSWKVDFLWQSEGTRSFDFDWASPPVDITLPPPPPLPGFQLTLDEASTEDVAMQVDHIVGAQLGPIEATDIRLQQGRAPSNGFQVSGLGLAGAALTGLSLPAAEVAAARFARVVAQIDIPALVVKGLAAPQGSGGDLELGGLDLQPLLDERATELNLDDRLILKLSVTPSVTVRIAKLILPDVTVGLDIESIAIERLRAVLQAQGISVSRLQIVDTVIPEVRIGP